MRVGFMGTPGFAVPTLQGLLESRHEVAAVVAQPDRPAGRGQQLVSPPSVQIARAQHVPVLQPRSLRSGPFPEAWVALGLDVAVVVAYGRVLPPAILAAPRFGCINVHASLLPRWRGAAPIQWAIASGDAETGVTTMQMDEGLDTGDILLQRATPIGPEETSADVALRLSEMGTELLLETLDDLPRIVRRPQDGALATWAPPLCREDGRVDWSQGGRTIDARVRGLSPWPGVWSPFRGDVLRIVQVRPVVVDTAGAAPGTVVEARRRLVVAVGDGALELAVVQTGCRRAQEGSAWLLGARVQVGEVIQ
ncbi:MAG: methionyl-tRNA formyltransferase [Deltaproteobacteria bacterium]|nr:methionyl-tRNA formyltransferase [Deltaproteobacteria bacterium]